ncbi:GTP cyclohydrolase, FolE2/MptA family [Desulfotalea psychrophila]|uniref:GTP cyclohydrolase I n=1 Tax=Desulfotalea psychrophila (strain LSv54 / DSM 12343) TaxID=177439 RepID=Q6AN60_DESPS|nr:GTP cyclohydrolase, FolE2/MptA family [Desulfotalea psychrophila]CAG36214.1 conserved hypothetical protein [Desulfotalea psychrophila LSv54]
MKDIQNQRDTRQVDIRKVGVKTVSYPIVVLDKAQKKQHTIAQVNMYVNLPHHFKGTHMSRFVQILAECHGEIDLQNFIKILEKMKERLSAAASHLEMFFPYFLQRDKVDATALLTKYNCGLCGSLQEESNLRLSLDIPIYYSITSGENRTRWGHVDLSLHLEKFYWIEDIIEQVEGAIEVSPIGHDSEVATSTTELAHRIGGALALIDEVESFSLTVHHQSENFSTFAQLESNL